MMKKLPYYWKAVVGFVAPGAVLLVAATLEDSTKGETITQSELLVAFLTCVITAGGVALKGNKKKA